MRRATVLRRAWGVPVIWAISDELPEQLTATAETVPTVRRPLVVRRLALPSGSVVTTEEES